MTFSIHALRTHKQLLVLLLWIVFIGCVLWQHAQQSQQPPIHDAAAYYLKAYNFWTAVHQQMLFNPFNVEPTFRPPGTILLSAPFGFDTDYRGFYFRSIFLPIVLLCLAVVIAAYRRELDNKSKWHLVLFAAFLSSLPSFYQFEPSRDIPFSSYWGLVDNFFAGVAALATAAMVRSVRTHSLTWLVLATVLASFCLVIKPVGLLIMMLIGLIWFGLVVVQLKSVWQSPNERKSTSLRFVGGMIIFAVPYLITLNSTFTSDYLSTENLALGNANMIIMTTESLPSWHILQNVIQKGIGYPFVVWLFLMIGLIANYLWRTPVGSSPWSRAVLTGLALASFITLVFGIWFWVFGAGGINNIRYFIPFVLVAMILALPAIMIAGQALSNWKMSILSVFMIAPIINMAMLLPQRNAPIEWQQWTGVNLTSGASNTAIPQVQNFIAALNNEGRKNVTLYSMAMDMTDTDFQSVMQYRSITMPTSMPISSMIRPIDWQRPSTYRKAEMLGVEYWVFQPVSDPSAAQAALALSSIDDFDQERRVFQAWATQLTTNDGVTIVSNTPMAKILHITDVTKLESAFDALVAKHHWRDIFVTANPKSQFSEKEMLAALTLNPASLENINFENHFFLRALSISRTDDDITVRFWWKPLSPLAERDWSLFAHSIDEKGEIIFNNGIAVNFTGSLPSLDGAFLFGQLIIKSPVKNGIHRLGIGFVRPNQAALIADKGLRDWDNHRVIVPLP